MKNIQEIFNPLDYGFKWVRDNRYNPPYWYEYDGAKSKKKALIARNKRAKELRAQGYTVVSKTMRSQLLSMGGIGSGRPHVTLVVNVPILTAFK